MSTTLSAQVTRTCFNEILVNNKTNFIDDYAQRSSWIELFNASFNVVDIGGCFLSNDPNNPTMYMIPKGDVLTKIQKRQHVVFFADGHASKGNFHLNFTLDTAGTNTLYFYNTDGKTLIDSVTIPVLEADLSYGRLIDGEANWGVFTRVTPSTNNLTLDSNEKVDKFALNDPDGVGMSLSAVAVVFSVLLLLSLFFYWFAVAFRKATTKPKMRDVVHSNIPAEGIPGEVIAAISAAIYEMENDVHDIENTIITIERTRRTYSPWSSKIYGLRKLPRK
ncbi:MAG: lamin tail domain-containing protein [Bacteroidales bacterium]|nr:lamin tail domain-containing protein [Bacteroidales bacterium]MDD4362328.1 lamin tail domain-containing protein [Bacteroidales bacterium]MDD4431299.1 lamin tail domain-containing protein [Bacteroidales bacterium]